MQTGNHRRDALAHTDPLSGTGAAISQVGDNPIIASASPLLEYLVSLKKNWIRGSGCHRMC